jgi:hypothetical protein
MSKQSDIIWNQDLSKSLFGPLKCSRCGKPVFNRFCEWQANGGICNECRHELKPYKEALDRILGLDAAFLLPREVNIK